ncbi:MAG TPA: hypothetical protein ENH10_04555 [Bacteroidetes bacterium]|nr:hypothetical protein BMS3Bbin04_01327 [bacterium BMS3Bbin04]HDO65286.1 hypothetical protein [Bacteroidota bacterium]HEX04411.1 hypothetical protein [Bacteroidota bacterium]
MKIHQLTLIVTTLLGIIALLNSAIASSKSFEVASNWEWTLVPTGQIWAYQHTEKDPTSTWDYGAELLFQIGEGYGHSLWFGAGYRQAAGFDNSGSITPFNPRHIDSGQFLSWRWRPVDRFVIFSHLERWCYHEIDIRSPMSFFSTNVGFGFGTVSPVESLVATTYRAWKDNRSCFDAYVFAGPMIHGGPAEILGNQPLRQGEAEGLLVGAWPVYKSLLIELRAEWDLLLLRESADVRLRHRGDLRLSLLVQREAGLVSLFVGHHPHDDYPDRSWPVSMYIGLAYRM